MDDVISNPGADDEVRLLTEAFHARRRGELAQALGLFLRVFANDPTNPYPLVEAARTECLRLDFPHLRELLARAEALARAEGTEEEVWLGIASCWLEALLPEECERVCRTAPDAVIRTGVLLPKHLEALERSGRTAEGVALLDRLPEVPVPCRAIGARLLRREGRTEGALALLSGLDGPAALMERARALDVTGRFRNAAESLERAKRLQAEQPEAAYERQLRPRQLEHRERVRQALGPGVVAGWAGAELGPRRRLAFILGHPRSGTTLLETLLEKTGGVVIASEYPVLEQEIAAWVLARSGGGGDPALALLHAPAGDIAAIREAYWRRITAVAEPAEGRLLVDKNPGLTDGVHWIARCWPEAPLVVLLRDPRDVIVSCLFQDFGLSPLGVQCLSWEGAARAWAATMAHWVALRGHLPEGNWREVRYEELVADPAARLAEVAEFLGLPAGTGTDHGPLARLIRTPSYAEVAAPVHRRAVGRWQAYDRWLRPQRPVIEPVMNQLGYAW